MQYFITGATGFIGKRLVAKLLEREDSRIFYLVRDLDPERLVFIDETATATNMTRSHGR